MVDNFYSFINEVSDIARFNGVTDWADDLNRNIRLYLMTLIGEINDKELWAKVEQTIIKLAPYQTRGIFNFVMCNDTINTPETVQNHELRVVVGKKMYILANCGIKEQRYG